MMNKPQQLSEEEALRKLTALCAKSEHCSADMSEKMRRWGVDAGSADRIMQYLREHKYVDDARYSRSFVSDKVRFGKWGRRRIEQELRMKRISRDDYGEALDAVSDDDYLNVLRPMLRSKAKQIKAKSDYEATMKLIRYALGRGYEMNLIRQCVDADDVECDEADF